MEPERAATLTLNQAEYPISSTEELWHTLSTIEGCQFCEVWLSLEDEASICALVNGQRALLMFLRDEGDPGFSSRNLDAVADDHRLVEFYLSNGQRDRYPYSYTVPLDLALRALEFVLVHGDKPPWIHWHDDSVVVGDAPRPTP